MVVRAGGIGPEAGKSRGGSEEVKRCIVSALVLFIFIIFLWVNSDENRVSCGFPSCKIRCYCHSRDASFMSLC